MGEINKNKTMESVVSTTKSDASKHKWVKKNELNLVFGELCTHIADNIKQQLPIRDDTLLNFNKMVIYLVENNFSSKITHFEEISQYICEYMRYGLANDDNNQRVYSYIRLSQMIDTLRIFHEDRNIEIKAHQEALKHPEYSKIIYGVKCSQAGTYKLPQKVIELDEKILLDLKRKGFVIEGGIQNDKYYILSKIGDALFRNLCFDGNYDWVDQWSDKRIIVFSQCLLLLSKLKSDIAVKDITRVISALGEKDINVLFEKMKQDLRLKKEWSFLVGDALKPLFINPYITEKPMREYYKVPPFESDWLVEEPIFETDTLVSSKHI